MKYPGLKNYFLICLFNLVIAASMGVLLRSAFFAQPFFNYQHLLHAHSHVAALGWAYQILSVLIFHFFVKDQWKKFNRLFWVTQISVLGMMLSFPFQGYAFFSILFSSLHIICSYVFVFFVWKNAIYENRLEKILTRVALLFLVLSTLAIWTLGPVIVFFGKDTIYYHLTIQFYLHFQFQGWFIFVLLAMLVRFFRNRFNENIFLKWSGYPFFLLAIAVVLNFAIILFGFYKIDFWYYLNSAGNILLISSVLFALYYLKKFRDQNTSSMKTDHNILIKFALVCLGTKLILQMVAFIPDMAIYVVKFRYFSIGYIHLILLGALTSFVLGWFQTQNYFSKFWLTQIAIFFFMMSVILTSGFLFIQGFLILRGGAIVSEFQTLLFVLSIILLISLLLVFSTVFKKFLVTTNFDVG